MPDLVAHVVCERGQHREVALAHVAQRRERQHEAVAPAAARRQRRPERLALLGDERLAQRVEQPFARQARDGAASCARRPAAAAISSIVVASQPRAAITSRAASTKASVVRAALSMLRSVTAARSHLAPTNLARSGGDSDDELHRLHARDADRLVALRQLRRAARARGDGSIGGYRRYAGFWRRAAAVLVDLVLVAGPFALVLWLLPDRERLDLVAVAALVLVAYQLGVLAWSGDTWGKRLLRAHVVEDDGRPIGRGRVSAREGVAKILEATALLVPTGIAPCSPRTPDGPAG